MLEYKLSDTEKQFAENHHNLIYGFLRSRNLKPEEWYDVVVFGYLNAVHNWFSRPELQQYAFATIAYKSMFSSYGSTLRNNGRKPNDAISLSAPVIGTENITLEDTLPDNCDLCDEVISKVSMQAALQQLPPKSRDVIQRKINGQTQTEIAVVFGVTQSVISRIISQARQLVGGEITCQ